MRPDLVATITDPKPWIGSAYLRQPVRTLVMGESHNMPRGEPAPSSGDALTEYTIRAIEWRIRGEEHNRFFAESEWVICSDPALLDQPATPYLEPQARSDAWHSVSFANFVPRVMSSQDEKPHAGDFTAGRERFPTLINALQPELICLFSRRAFDEDGVPWGNAPHDDGLEREPVPDETYADVYDYPLAGGKSTLLAVFHHPSSRTKLSADETRSRFKRLQTYAASRSWRSNL